MRGYTKTEKMLFFRRTLAGLIIASIVMYIFLAVLANWIIIVEKMVMVRIYQLLKIMVLEPSQNVMIIWLPGKKVVTIILTEECIGIYSIIAYALFVLIVPTVSLKNKLRGLAMGCSVLFLANIVRIMTSGVLGVLYGFLAFRFFHDVVGGGLMIILVTVIWVDWVYRVFRYGRY
ncbi:MAG: exosortase/archaeosortase family protein [Ignisphaera sp.]